MFAWHDRETAAAAESVFRRGFLDDEKVRVLTAGDATGLDALIRRFLGRIGFERYSLMVIDDDFSSATSSVILECLNNTPTEYLQEWSSQESARRDPAMQQSKHTVAPIVYDRAIYELAGAAEKWEMQAPFGYASGICSTFHLPGTLHVFFGIDTSSALPDSRSELAALVSECHLFGTFVQCAALNVLNVDRPGADPGVRLSPREHECLQWAAEGKTAWETGMILSIAEGSVNKILGSAIRKLDCANKPQAVVKALRLGLIR